MNISLGYLFTINRFLPSTEEAEMYKNYKDDPSTLVPEDQFMMKVSVSSIDSKVRTTL